MLIMKTILVIEDEQAVRESILDLLEAEGFRGVGSENGHRGVQLAQEHHPDLILCDIQMPEMDGYGVLTQLRQAGTTSAIPFIFLSAKSTKGDIRRGMELGADDYLTKPCTATELLGAISSRLAKHAAISQRLQQEPTPEAATTPETLSTRDGLLNHFYQELRNPLSQINMAIHFLKLAPGGTLTPEAITMVQQDYSCELAILAEVYKLQDYLMPESTELLRACNLADLMAVAPDLSHLN
jgi:two-component system, OmpR family, alkaline phosphatase synthesis response regulator PhoP